MKPAAGLLPGFPATRYEVDMDSNALSPEPRRHALRKAVPAACRTLACVLLLACGACDGPPDGATDLAVAPGRPGTGNPTIVVAPQPVSSTESPQTGGARWLVPEGATGKPAGRRAPGKDAVFDLPGVGLDGGLGAPATRPGGG